MKLRVPVVKIIRLLLPAIKSTVRSIADARTSDSDGGKKVTKDEWEDILAEAMLELVPDLAEELKKANS
jgi:hypothetical protein